MKVETHHEYIQRLATAAIELLNSGNPRPLPPEIASQAAPGGRVPRHEVEEVRKRLPEVRRALHDQGFVVVPVSEPYYRLRRRSHLEDRDISRCLAIGRGKQEAGILFVTDGDELAKHIKVAHERWTFGTGAGRMTASRDRIGLALEEGILTQDEALALTGSEIDRAAIMSGEDDPVIDDALDVIDCEIVEDREEE